MNKIVIGTAALVAATACGGSGSGPSSSAPPSTVHGSVLIYSGAARLGDTSGLVVPQYKPLTEAKAGDACYGDSGANMDGVVNASISVTDQAGAIAGRGQAANGKIDLQIDSAPVCVVPFTLTDLQPAKFYTVTIGRRSILLSARDLAAHADDLRLHGDSDARYWVLAES